MIMNEAVRRAGDETLIIFSDGDCIPPAHFVARHLAVHEPLSFHLAGAIRLSKEDSQKLTETDVDAGVYESLGTSKDWKILRLLFKFDREDLIFNIVNAYPHNSFLDCRYQWAKKSRLRC